MQVSHLNYKILYMMAEGLTALFSVGLLLILTHETLSNAVPTAAVETYPIRLTVDCDLANKPLQSYSTDIVKEGVLLGALNRLNETDQDFKFTMTLNPNFGLFLESVNGIAGSEVEKTYWELLSEKEGKYSWLNMGIGCYTPKPNEHIILRLSKWKP